MDNQELLQKLEQDLGNISASRQAHQHILQILNTYKQKLNADTEQVDADLKEQ